MDDASSGAMLACLLAAIFIILAVRAAASGTPRLLRMCAFGGGALLAGATLYMHSAMGLAPLVTTVIAGAWVGTTDVGKVRWRTTHVIAGLQGLAGVAVMATVAAIHWDPQAIGLADPMAQTLWAHDRLPLALAMALGSGTAAGSLAAGLRRNGALPRREVGWRILLLVMLIATGVLIRLFCVMPGAVVLWPAAATASIAGGAFVWSTSGDDQPVAQALLAALLGFAAALIGFPLHNPAMIAIGGVVGGGGAMLAIRLLRSRRREAPLSNGSLSS